MHSWLTWTSSSYRHTFPQVHTGSPAHPGQTQPPWGRTQLCLLALPPANHGAQTGSLTTLTLSIFICDKQR